MQISYQRAFTRRRDLARQHFYSSNEVKEHSIIPNRSHWLPLYDKGLEAQVGKMALKNALENLSPEQWKTLRLYFFEGYSLEEIAVRKALFYQMSGTTTTVGLTNCEDAYVRNNDRGRHL